MRQESWCPGTWGTLLSTGSKWSAIIDDTSLRVNREIYPIHAVKAVRVVRGAIWARVLVEHEDGTSRPLGGLTNRVAAVFAESLTAACILSSVARLKSLLGDAQRQRGLWLHLTSQCRWLAQSEVPPVPM